MVFLHERARLVEIHGPTLALAKGKAHRRSGFAREVQILASIPSEGPPLAGPSARR